ncbi:hypothetical protein LX87_05469 [Larkinella arboricola]|uniref:Lipoprotein n=2 Tax=Larkinella arboricola TaxID=643671 RepID=A0A327WIH4_LARAB|nr:hypothetical protein LX87_05469 [Larkinella arboricola]
MKPCLSIIKLIAFLTFLVGCQKKERVDPCPQAGAFVRELKEAVGTVYYDSTAATYGIQVATSMDSADMGLTCNLPVDYQKPMTQVRFTGRYYEREKRITGPVGYRFYYLTVSSIAPL